jgi:hypothetical protein
MTAWQRDERFCIYVHRRIDQRRSWVQELYQRAQNDHSRRMADKLAQRWGMPHQKPQPAPSVPVSGYAGADAGAVVKVRGRMTA